MLHIAASCLLAYSTFCLQLSFCSINLSSWNAAASVGASFPLLPDMNTETKQKILQTPTQQQKPQKPPTQSNLSILEALVQCK